MAVKDKPTRRKDQRPAEIVQAAYELFADAGFANTKITEIAQRAGAAKGTVYLYFDTKEELFEAVVRTYIKPVFSTVKQIVDSFPGSASELLAKLIERIYAELANSPQRRGILRILIAEGERFPHLTEFYHREVISGAMKVLKSVIKRGVDAGEFRPAVAANHPGTIMGPVILAAIWKMTFEHADPLDIEKFSKAHVDLILNGLRADSHGDD